jgi:parallel beta-helix repeat protein
MLCKQTWLYENTYARECNYFKSFKNRKIMKKEKAYTSQCNCLTAGMKFYVCLLVSLLYVTTGCHKEITSVTSNENNDVLSLKVSKTDMKATIVVQPGSSIQAAITAAVAGTEIRIKPGTYKEKIVVDKPGITLSGDGNVVIENPGGIDIGIKVVKGADGFMLSNVTVQGFTDRAVEIKEINGLSLSHVTAIGNNTEEFGLFVQDCTNGTIEHCESTGHTDTGIFVGESTNISISQNKSYANTIGIETENVSDVTIDKNHLYDNSAGILSLLVPGKSVSLSSNIKITKNQVRDNNHTNLQNDPTELEAILPSGIGILILGPDNVMVEDNHVTGNQYTGIAVVSTAILGPTPGIDPVPDNVKVFSNQVIGNGLNPQSSTFPASFASDLLWLGPAIGATGSGNCWSKNEYNTSFPSPLPDCN